MSEKIERLKAYASQMIARRDELQSLSYNLAFEYLACGIEHLEDDDIRKMAYKRLSQGIEMAMEGNFILEEIAIKNFQAQEVSESGE